MNYAELSNYENLIIETYNDKICIVKLNNKNGLNILNNTILRELKHCIEYLDDRDEMVVVIITGNGDKAFSAGADIKEMSKMDCIQSKDYSKLAMDTFYKIYNSKKIFISAINGIALGGGVELSLFCDFRIASGEAKLGNPEIKLGITCGFGGTQMLSKVIGVSNAKRLLLTGRVLNAEEALKIGLVDNIFEDSLLMEETKKLADELSTYSSIALRKMKHLVNKSAQLSIEEGLGLENKLFSELFDDEETKQGLKTYISKR